MTPVTKVTTGRILTDEDYCEMYAELEGDGTPHTVVKRIGEPPSAAAWYKWRKGDGPLTANMQAKLRSAHGITTVMDACAMSSETATVYQVGEGVPDTVVMVALSEPVTLRVNGSVSVVTDCHAIPSNSSGDARKRIRRTYSRPCATEAQNSRKEALGVSWAEVIDAGLRMYEVMP